MIRRKTIQRIMPYFILACSLVTGIVIVRPLQDFIHQELRQIRSSLVEAIERASGLTVHYSHLSPSLLLRAEVNDVSLERPDGSVLFSADQVRISYNIMDFLSGSPLTAVRSIEMVGGQLHYDQSKDEARFGLVSTKKDQGSGYDSVPNQIRDTIEQWGRSIPSGLELSFIDTRIEVKTPDYNLNLQSPSAGLKSSEDRLDVHVGLGLNSTLTLPGLRGRRFEGELNLEAQFFRKTRQLQTQVSSRRLLTPWGELAPQKLALSLSPDEIRLSRIADQEPIDLDIRWKLAIQKISVEFSSEAWQLASQFKPSVSLNDWQQALFSGVFSSRFKLVWDISTKRLDYEGQVSGKGSWKAAQDMVVEADLSGNSTSLPNGEIQVVMPGADVRF